jgi:hypothetical protein
MFGFRKKTLDPVVGGFVQKIDDILKSDNTAEKIDRLFAARDEAGEQLKKIARHEKIKGIVACILPPVGTIATVFALTALPSLPVVLGILPTVVFFSGLAVACNFGRNEDSARRDCRTLEAKIDAEIGNVLAAKPEEAVKSPRLMNQLKAFFNLSAERAASYGKLSLRAKPASPRPA